MNPCDDELQEWPGPFLKMSCCEAVFWREGNTCKGQTYPYICHIVDPSQRIGVVFDADFWLDLMKESRNYYDLYLERFEEKELKEWIVGKFQSAYSHEQFVHLLYNFDDNGKDNIVLRVERLRVEETMNHEVVKLVFSFGDVLALTRFIQKNIKADRFRLKKECINL